MLFISSLLLWSCNGSGKTILYREAPAPPQEDTAAQPPSDIDTASEDSAETIEPEEEPAFELGTAWSGTRRVSFESCTDELREDGTKITGAPETEVLQLLCTNCTEFYALSISPDRICYDQVPVATQLYRGIILHNETEMTIYGFSSEESGFSIYRLADAVRDADRWRYAYDSTFQSYVYSVEGTIEFF
ncbi:MAG: hypothetical protein VX278_09080 [Myxococcota bacterium]|nr:hypothetical protein [Myxococcota bacterium]